MYYCNRALVNKKYINELAEVVAAIANKKDAAKFLEGMLTPAELEEISNRLQILKMLKKSTPQREVAKKLGVSIGTISRGSRELKYGNDWWKDYI